MRYTFKLTPELVWFIVTSMVVFVAQLLFTFDPTKITDWRLWAVTVGGGAARALGGAVLYAIFGPSQPSLPQPGNTDWQEPRG